MWICVCTNSYLYLHLYSTYQYIRMHLIQREQKWRKSQIFVIWGTMNMKRNWKLYCWREDWGSFFSKKKKKALRREQKITNMNTRLHFLSFLHDYWERWWKTESEMTIQYKEVIGVKKGNNVPGGEFCKIRGVCSKARLSVGGCVTKIIKENFKVFISLLLLWSEIIPLKQNLLKSWVNRLRSF